MTNRGSMRMITKQSKDEHEPNPTIVVPERSTSKQMIASFFGKMVMWRLFYLNIVGRSILRGTPQFVCLKSSRKLQNVIRGRGAYIFYFSCFLKIISYERIRQNIYTVAMYFWKTILLLILLYYKTFVIFLCVLWK